MKLFSTILITIMFSFQLYGQSSDTNPSNNTSSNLPGLISDEAVGKIICGDDLQISDHMREMGFIIRKLTETVQNIINGEDFDEFSATVMMDAQVLRTHLTAVLPSTPAKIKNIDQNNIQTNKLMYQKYLVKMIGYTIDLESELIKRPLSTDEIDYQRLKIANLIIEIDETVSQAHNKFRD